MSSTPNYLQKVMANQQGRDFVCGDLHGQLDQLFAALSEINFSTEKDRLFVVGDVVDRGEQSRQAFELLQEPWFFSVRGNHEALLFDAYAQQSEQAISTWQNNGGRQWAPDAQKLFTEPHFAALLQQQIATMPWAIELGLNDGRRVGLIHAECPCDDWHQLHSCLSEAGIDGNLNRYNAIWSRAIRTGPYASAVRNVDLTVHGHCIFKEPVRHHNRCYIDTGAYLQSSHLFGLVKKPRGALSVLSLEQLFNIPELSWHELKDLSR